MMRLDINEIKYWINKTIPDLLEKHLVPGAAVAVFIDGEVVFTGVGGYEVRMKKNQLTNLPCSMAHPWRNPFSHENESFFFQWGDNPGINHFAASSSTKRGGLVVLTNGQNGRRVCRPVVETVLGSKLDVFDNI
jgi:hypothetical protein